METPTLLTDLQIRFIMPLSPLPPLSSINFEPRCQDLYLGNWRESGNEVD